MRRLRRLWWWVDWVRQGRSRPMTAAEIQAAIEGHLAEHREYLWHGRTRAPLPTDWAAYRRYRAELRRRFNADLWGSLAAAEPESGSGD